MRLRALVPCVVAALTLSACGAASDLVSVEPADRTGEPTAEPTEPSTPPTTAKPSEPPTQTPETTPTKKPDKGSKQRPRKRLPNVVGKVKFFSSPSENIGCLISRTGVRCDIKQKSYRQPPRPNRCQLDFGRSLEVGVGDRRAQFVCVGDTVLGAGKILRYRTSSEVGKFGCTSRKSGMFCYNLETRHGFMISRRVVDVF